MDFSTLPRQLSKQKPDFMSQETQFKKGDSSKFYPSHKALGQLFRDVEIPKTLVVSRQAG